jgi:hypothetical protein
MHMMNYIILVFLMMVQNMDGGLRKIKNCMFR